MRCLLPTENTVPLPARKFPRWSGAEEGFSYLPGRQVMRRFLAPILFLVSSIPVSTHPFPVGFFPYPPNLQWSCET
jgi:hypothetical protein